MLFARLVVVFLLFGSSTVLALSRLAPLSLSAAIDCGSELTCGDSCCPHSYGVCCPGNVGCCPQGHTCDVSRGTCLRPGSVEPTLLKGDHECVEFCVGSGKCCKAGWTCDSEQDVCLLAIKSSTKLPSMAKFNKTNELEAIICPDLTACTNSQTCCLQLSGSYGCCPYATASCCPDLQSCCPTGYRCTNDGTFCVPSTTSLTKTTPAEPKQRQLKAQILSQSSGSNSALCVDGSSCPAGNTCCFMEDGPYGCCSFDGAVCCEDKKSCCPSGYLCDIKHKRCTKNA